MRRETTFQSWGGETEGLEGLHGPPRMKLLALMDLSLIISVFGLVDLGFQHFVRPELAPRAVCVWSAQVTTMARKTKKLVAAHTQNMSLENLSYTNAKMR